MSLRSDSDCVQNFMDLRRLLYDNDRRALLRKLNRGVVINTRLLVVLLLLPAVISGCVSNEPRRAAGAPYSEEIKPPVPRDALLFSPDCVVR